MTLSETMAVLLMVAIVAGSCYCAAGTLTINSKGEVITIHVLQKTTCIENEHVINRVVTDVGAYTTYTYLYDKLEIGKTYDVRLTGTFPLFPEMPSRIVSIVNAPCVEGK